MTVAAFAVPTWLCGNIVLPSLLKDPSIRWGVASTLGAALAGLAAAWGYTFATVNQSPAPSGVSAQATAEDLASEVAKQWQKEERRRGVHDPFPLAVRFRLADTGLFDHWAKIRRIRGTDPGPLPLAGDVDRIMEKYRSIPSGRLVVLGAAGAGKTILALRFVLDWLEARAPGDPVPVIFGLGSWDPAAISLRDWMCDQLMLDHPWLAAPALPGGNLAEALTDARLILPVLDGFDEIAPGLHPQALRELNTTDMPLLLTSRTEEYVAALRRARVLTRAAAVELDDLTVDDLAEYLPLSSAPAQDGTVWDPVLEELRHERRSPGAEHLAAVLSTPLMVAMARTIYSETPGHHASELAGFATREALRDHLLAAFIPAAYAPRPTDRNTERDTGRHRRRNRQRWHADRAQRWLGYLAEHLDQLGRERNEPAVERNIAWWELGTTLRRSSRILVIGLLAALAFGVTTGVGNVPVDLLGARCSLNFALQRGLVVGLMHGLAAGLAFGLAYGLVSGGAARMPSRVGMRFFGRTRELRTRFAHRFAPRFLVGFALGTPFALVLVLVDRGVVAKLGLSDGFDNGPLVGVPVFALGIGLGTGLVLGLIAWLEEPDDITSGAGPSDLLQRNGMNAVAHMLMWALVFGVGGGLAGGLTAGPGNGLTAGLLGGLLTGLVFGLEAAFGGGLGYALSLSAWGQWLALARIWLPLTGRLPWKLITFLDDACERGVLRKVGAVYQFRHAQLQDHLTVSLAGPGRLDNEL
ncbi:NACHT domain-containing protein [Streptomyces asiaticus]